MMLKYKRQYLDHLARRAGVHHVWTDEVFRLSDEDIEDVYERALEMTTAECILRLKILKGDRTVSVSAVGTLSIVENTGALSMGRVFSPTITPVYRTDIDTAWDKLREIITLKGINSSVREAELVRLETLRKRMKKNASTYCIIRDLTPNTIIVHMVTE